jgi:hypothetical protein
MATPEKRRTSAHQLLLDIRAGMDGEQLKQKHSLSDRSLELVLSKLAAGGHLTEAEMGRLSLTEPTVPNAPEKDSQAATLRKCPACDAPLPSDSQECPVCGVVVAKFVARREQENLPSFPVQPGDSDAGKRWLLIGCILAVVVVAGGFFLYWWKERTRLQPAGSSKVSEKAPKKSGAAAKAQAAKAQADKSAKEKKTPNIFAMSTGELLELGLVPKGFPLGLSVGQGSGGIHFFETPDPNQGFKKFPPETDAKRYYDQFTIADQTFLMITEASNPPKIYLDANRNGDMTDDPGPFEGEGPNAAPNHYTLEFPYKGEEIAAPYRLWLFPSRMGGIRFYPHCYWLGQIEINGASYKVVTFDGNADGDYSNDPLIIDVDNDGKAADSERLKPGQSLAIDGTEVKLLGIAPSGRWVRLQY